MLPKCSLKASEMRSSLNTCHQSVPFLSPNLPMLVNKARKQESNLRQSWGQDFVALVAFAVCIQLFWSVQSSPQSSPVNSPVHSPVQSRVQVLQRYQTKISSSHHNYHRLGLLTLILVFLPSFLLTYNTMMLTPVGSYTSG